MQKKFSIAGLVNRLQDLLKGKGDAEGFSCGDCRKNERCGAEPSPLCVVRAAQIEQDGGRARKRSILVS